MPRSIGSHSLPPADDEAAFRRAFTDNVWLEAARDVAARHSLRGTLQRSPYGENVVIDVGDRYVLKIFAPARAQNRREIASLRIASSWRALESPELVATGNVGGFEYLVMTRVSGVRLTEIWPRLDEAARMPIVKKLGEALRELHDIHATSDEPSLNRDWRAFINSQAETTLARQRACDVPARWLAELPEYLRERDRVRSTRVFLHGDVHAGNLIANEENGRWQINGVVDFGDAFFGDREYDFVAPGVLMVQGQAALQRAMFDAYGCRNVDDDFRRRLMLLTIFYECSDLKKYATRLRPDAINLSLAELERAIWSF